MMEMIGYSLSSITNVSDDVSSNLAVHLSFIIHLANESFLHSASKIIDIYFSLNSSSSLKPSSACIYSYFLH